MKINFTQEEINDIVTIIDNYKSVSESLIEYQEKADDIQKKVIKLQKELDSLKNKEQTLMTDLHNKYGNFSLQDVYDIINYGNK